MDEFSSVSVTEEEKNRIVRQVSSVGIGGNIALTAFKFLAGILGHSGAMISDAVHSLSDVLATFIAFIGVKIAGKAADDEHPYGHERFETLASMLLSVILVIAGIGIGWSGIEQILHWGSVETEMPGVISLVAAAVSIVSKEAMFQYTKKCAKKIGSRAFLADAWHHRSDALSSIGALIGIGAARLGLPILDPVAQVVICLFILKTAWDIFSGALPGVMDQSCSREYEEQLRQAVLENSEVRRVDLLRTRRFGERVYVELDLAVDDHLSLRESHDIAEQVHFLLENRFQEIKHVTTHMNPENHHHETHQHGQKCKMEQE